MKLNLVIYGVLVLAAGCSVAGADNVKLSHLITKHAAAYGIERVLLSCVLKVESSYRLNVISETQDYGIAQINIKTAKGYNFNLHRLTTDLNYSVAAGAEVLAAYQRVFAEAEVVNWVGRYNIGYQSLKVVGTPYQVYANKVWACRQSNNYL